jgi:RNA polymerase sigma-70 factor, ECF subfamily
MNDSELLKAFIDHASQSAFAEIVDKYSPMVHSTCNRLLGGDHHSAKDVAQSVFLILIKKSPSLKDYVTLGPWLYKTAVLEAKWQRREMGRRKTREGEAMNEQFIAGENNKGDLGTEWNEIRPLLDYAMGLLPSKDADALVMRFFNELSWDDVASGLGCSTDSARMRAKRALGKLSGIFKKKGIIISVSSIKALLSMSVDASTGFVLEAFSQGTLLIPSEILSETKAGLLAKEYLKMIFLKKIYVGSAVMLASVVLVAGISMSRNNDNTVESSILQSEHSTGKSNRKSYAVTKNSKKKKLLAKKQRNAIRAKTTEYSYDDVILKAESNPREAFDMLQYANVDKPLKIHKKAVAIRFNFSMGLGKVESKEDKIRSDILRKWATFNAAEAADYALKNNLLELSGASASLRNWSKNDPQSFFNWAVNNPGVTEYFVQSGVLPQLVISDIETSKIIELGEHALAEDRNKRDRYLQLLLASLCNAGKVDTACRILNDIYPENAERSNEATLNAWSIPAKFIAKKDFNAAIKWSESLSDTDITSSKKAAKFYNIRARAIFQVLSIAYYKKDYEKVDSYLNNTTAISDRDREQMIANFKKRKHVY